MITKLFFLPRDMATGFNSDGRTALRTVNEYELVLFLDDGGRSVINGVPHDIKRGELRIHKPGDNVYSYRYSDAYVLHLSKKFADGGIIDGLKSFVRLFDVESEAASFDEMIRLYVCKSPVMRLKLKQMVYELLFKAADGSRNAPPASEYIADTVDAAKRFMRDNFSKEITLADISKAVHLHPNYLHRIFRQTAKITPHEYLTKLRITEAERLLLGSDATDALIAEQCGFSSHSYFISVFKRRCGCTPARYRKHSYTDAT